jgi:chromosome segregation ATPase
VTILPVILTIVGALVGSGGIVFGALRFNRDETGKTVTQHSKILADMESVNQHLIDELVRLRNELATLRIEHDRVTEERNEYRDKVDSCTDQVSRLKRKVASLEQIIESHEKLIEQLRGASGG